MKFHASNKIVYGLVITILLVIIAGLFIFFISGPNIISEEMQDWLSKYYMLIFGVVAALCFLGAGLLTKITRLYVYALLVLVTSAAGTWFDVHPAVYVIFTGLLIEAVGIWLMIRFLQKYPLPEQENAHE